MIGLVVHRLIVIADTGRGRGWHRYWLTKCECGSEKEVRADHLRNKKIMSCGCLRRESKPSLIHGGSKTVEYEVWTGMKGRCYNRNNKEYPRYGGRGIVVCERWLYSFENFLSDMGPRPPGWSIERKDVNGIYSPQNCL